MGLDGATIGMAVAIGPLVGGAPTDSLGWRSIFHLLSHRLVRPSRGLTERAAPM